MSGDTLVYDMSLMSEGSPQIFVKKDFLKIQDQQSGNYAGNQLVIDTSQLANSNKYTDYRNAYLSVPLVMAISSSASPASGATLLNEANQVPASGVTNLLSLKNWFGSIINSLLLDYAGTTIIQNTPLSGLWNTFTLMTSLSMADVITMGPTIGFYPDSSHFSRTTTERASGVGTCNNVKSSDVIGNLRTGLVGAQDFSNPGIRERWSKLMIDKDAVSGGIANSQSFVSIIGSDGLDAIYRSRVHSKSAAFGAEAGQYAFVAFQIQAFVYLRHIHSFFSQIPLLKGVFFRLTLNLNQPVVTLKKTATGLTIEEIISPLGGVSPIMVSSQAAHDSDLLATDTVIKTHSYWGLNAAAANDSTIRISLNVGNKLIDSTQQSRIPSLTTGLNTSCFLHVPMFTFNPSFESAYLSRPTKTIVYTDLYEYTTAEVPAAGQFNFLITNGISNIKSCIVLPMESKIAGLANKDYPPFWSPFDTCGGGSTCPMGGSALTNFNVVVAGQNMVYNQVTRAYEQFNENLAGVNAVNAGLVDGMTSGLVNYWDFLQMYGYFYINCARQLPIDEAVPKSLSISGKNNSQMALKLYVFIEYGVQVNVDVLTGARV